MPSRVRPVSSSVCGSTVRMYHVRVTRTPLCVRLDQFVRGLRAARHDDVAGRGGRPCFVLLGPVARILQVGHPALVDERDLLARQPFPVPGQHWHVEVGRAGVDADALVEELFAQPVAAAFLREEAAALVGFAGVERDHHPLEQPGGRGGLEDHGVLARLERLRARGTLGLGDACTRWRRPRRIVRRCGRCGRPSPTRCRQSVRTVHV